MTNRALNTVALISMLVMAGCAAQAPNSALKQPVPSYNAVLTNGQYTVDLKQEAGGSLKFDLVPQLENVRRIMAFASDVVKVQVLLQKEAGATDTEIAQFFVDVDPDYSGLATINVQNLQPGTYHLLVRAYDRADHQVVPNINGTGYAPLKDNVLVQGYQDTYVGTLALKLINTQVLNPDGGMQTDIDFVDGDVARKSGGEIVKNNLASDTAVNATDLNSPIDNQGQVSVAELLEFGEPSMAYTAFTTPHSNDGVTPATWVGTAKFVLVNDLLNNDPGETTYELQIDDQDPTSANKYKRFYFNNAGHLVAESALLNVGDAVTSVNMIDPETAGPTTFYRSNVPGGSGAIRYFYSSPIVTANFRNTTDIYVGNTVAFGQALLGMTMPTGTVGAGEVLHIELLNQ